jgi:hypothetical protein
MLNTRLYSPPSRLRHQIGSLDTLPQQAMELRRGDMRFAIHRLQDEKA